MKEYLEVMEKVEVIIGDKKKFYKNNAINKIKFTYRGEAEDFKESKLLPSLFRENYDEKKILEALKDQGVTESGKTIDKLIDAQHYIAISRLLDISYDINVALYFACCNSKERDGFLYVINYPYFFSPSSKYIEKCVENIIDGKIETQDTLYLTDMPKFISHTVHNERSKIQKGGFILFSGDTGYPLDDFFWNKVKIKKEEKEHILETLQSVFGIHEGSIFPEKNFQKSNILEMVNYSCDDNGSQFQNEINQYKEYIELKVKYLVEKGKDKEHILRILREYISIIEAKAHKQETNENIEKEKINLLYFESKLKDIIERGNDGK